MRFGTLSQNPVPFLKSGYVKTERHDKLRPKAFPCFFVGFAANHPRDTYEVFFSSGSVAHSRNVIWARSPPSAPDPAENVRSVSVSRKRGKLVRRRQGEVEVMRMLIVMSKASPPAFDRASLHAWFL